MWALVFFLVTIAFANGYEPRIIGGYDTTIEKHPYQVSIHYNGALKCGGSIISPNWVLTAAHCVYGLVPKLFQIRIQSTYNNQGGVLITGIQTVIVHDGYDSTYENDVALIKLPTSIKENGLARSVLLAQPTNNVAVGSNALVTGWGMTSPGGSMSNTLQAVLVPIVDQDTCKKIYASQNPVTRSMICAGTLSGGKDTCWGDSGGPLVFNGVQIGIVSWGLDCAKPKYPGVYTRVSAVRPWIKKWANV